MIGYCFQIRYQKVKSNLHIGFFIRMILIKPFINLNLVRTIFVGNHLMLLCRTMSYVETKVVLCQR